LRKLEDYSVGYKTSDIGLKDYYPNTDLIGFHYTLVKYICLSGGVYLRLAIEGNNLFIYYLFPSINRYINEYYFEKSWYACG